MTLRDLFSRRRTPQHEALPGQVANAAGGHAFAVDDWDRLDRFLVLGSEDGTFYIAPRALTRENAEAVERCLAADGARVVARVVEISDAGRTPKNDPALFVLAMATASDDQATRQAALAALPQVARTGTHLFHFAEFVEGFRGWGRGLRRAVASWYGDQPIDRLALQMVKYRQRDGWSHRDLLRLAHPVTADPQRRALFEWALRGGGAPALPMLAQGFDAAQAPGADVPALIRRHGLPREALPTDALNDVAVWAALLERMPMTATIRSLAKMSAVGLLRPMSEAAAQVATRLGDGEALRKARVHPLALLVAQSVYAQGRGLRGKLEWEPVAEVIDALDAAFYRAFANVEPTGKRLLLALDVSGSMTWGQVAGSPLTPREAAAAMVLVTAATERHVRTVGFSSAGRLQSRGMFGGSRADHGLVSLPISPGQRLADVLRITADLPFGGTDCALPMLYALDRGLEVDAFVVYTDSETWAGKIHPVQALRDYRRKTGIAAKLVVVGMVSNGFSIADPDDAGMLDVVGFDAAAPAVVADFIRR